MLQTLFSIGGFSLGSYGVVVAISLLIGLGVAYHLAPSEKEYRQHLIDLLIYAVIGAIIGARLWQVFFYEWDYYFLHLSEIFMIWHGGMAIQGALVGAFIVGWIYTRKHQLDFWKMADIAAPGIILGRDWGELLAFSMVTPMVAQPTRVLAWFILRELQLMKLMAVNPYGLQKYGKGNGTWLSLL